MKVGVSRYEKGKGNGAAELRPLAKRVITIDFMWAKRGDRVDGARLQWAPERASGGGRPPPTSQMFASFGQNSSSAPLLPASCKLFLTRNAVALLVFMVFVVLSNHLVGAGQYGTRKRRAGTDSLPVGEPLCFPFLPLSSPSSSLSLPSCVRSLSLFARYAHLI